MSRDVVVADDGQAGEPIVLAGRHDPFQKPHDAERLAGTIPNARLAWVDAAHWIMEERPDEVTRLLAEFVG